MTPELERKLETLEIASHAPVIRSVIVANELRWLIGEYRKLLVAIEKHRSATGHEMCHENDEELWAILSDGVTLDHAPPPWCEFMSRCALYRASKDKKASSGSQENV